MAESLKNRYEAARQKKRKLRVGITGNEGSGKTFSALKIAAGIAGFLPDGKPRRFAAIDTEGGNLSHYAYDEVAYPDGFHFDVLEMEPPFEPARFSELIAMAAAAGYTVLLIDSASHEWNGIGGVLEMVSANQKKLSRGDADRFDSMKQLAWVDPKSEHNKYLAQLYYLDMAMVFTYKAAFEKERVKQRIGGKMKTVTIDVGGKPRTDEESPFALTCNLLVHRSRPGTFEAWRDHKMRSYVEHLFRDGMMLNEDLGAALAAWAAGGREAPRKPRNMKQIYDDFDRCLSTVHRAPDPAAAVRNITSDPDWGNLLDYLSKERPQAAEKLVGRVDQMLEEFDRLNEEENARQSVATPQDAAS